MKITSLSASGLKAGDFKHNLDAVNLITGPNFSGKTARLDAIRVGLIGYLPELGKQNSSTFGLANNGKLQIRIETDTGKSATRSWEMQKGKIKHEAGMDLPPTPPVLLDPNEYFSLGEKDRVRYVFGMADIEGRQDTSDSLIANLKKIKFDDHSAGHEKAIQALCEKVDETDRTRHDVGQSIQDWVDELIKSVKGDLKTARATADRMAKMVQGSTEIQAGDDDIPARNVEPEVKAANKERDIKLESMAEAKSEKKRLVQVRNDRETIQKVIDAFVDQSKEKTELEEAISILEKSTKGFESKTVEFVKEVGKATSELRSKTELIARLNDELQDLRRKHDHHLSEEKCPYCGAHEDGWQDRIKDEFDQACAERNQEIENTNTLVVELKSTENRLKEDVENSQDRDAEYKKAFNQIQEWTKKLQQIERNENALALGKSKLEDLEVVSDDRIAEVEAMLLELQQKIGGLDGEITSLQTQQRRFHEAKQDEARNAQAVIQRQEITAEVEVIKEAVKMFDAFQEQMVKEVFTELLVTANKVTQGILKTPLEYKDGEIGRYQGPVWVSHKTFSGTEKAIAYAGISTALAKDAPIKIVMIDEMGRLDPENALKLIGRMVELTNDGTIDQFIGVDTRRQYDVEGVKVISV